MIQLKHVIRAAADQTLRKVADRFAKYFVELGAGMRMRSVSDTPVARAFIDSDNSRM